LLLRTVSTPCFQSTSTSVSASASDTRMPVQAINAKTVRTTAPRGLDGGPMRPAVSSKAAISSSL
jgi:hypothetical protein